LISPIASGRRVRGWPVGWPTACFAQDVVNGKFGDFAACLGRLLRGANTGKAVLRLECEDWKR
jgi:hypothetical protein